MDYPDLDEAREQIRRAGQSPELFEISAYQQLKMIASQRDLRQAVLYLTAETQALRKETSSQGRRLERLTWVIVGLTVVLVLIEVWRFTHAG